MPWVYDRPKVYWSDRYHGCWVASIDHGTWVEETFYDDWDRALDRALCMWWEVNR